MRRRDTLRGCMMSRSAFQDASTAQSFGRASLQRYVLPAAAAAAAAQLSCEFSNFFFFFFFKSAAVMHSLEEDVGST